MNSQNFFISDYSLISTASLTETHLEEQGEIYLRRIKETDVEQIMKWRMIPEVTKFMHTDPKLTMEGQLEWFKKIENDNTCMYRIIQANGLDIGLFGLFDIDLKNRRTNRIWYIADNRYKGKGIGSDLQAWCNYYIFNVLELNRSYSEVFANNTVNIKLNLKGGYEIEGMLKQHIYKNNEFHDIVILGLNKDKWERIKQNYSHDNIKFEE